MRCGDDLDNAIDNPMDTDAARVLVPSMGFTDSRAGCHYMLSRMGGVEGQRTMPGQLQVTGSLSVRSVDMLMY